MAIINLLVIAVGGALAMGKFRAVADANKDDIKEMRTQTHRDMQEIKAAVLRMEDHIANHAQRISYLEAKTNGAGGAG